MFLRVCRHILAWAIFVMFDQDLGDLWFVLSVRDRPRSQQVVSERSLRMHQEIGTNGMPNSTSLPPPSRRLEYQSPAVPVYAVCTTFGCGAVHKAKHSPWEDKFAGEVREHLPRLYNLTPLTKLRHTGASPLGPHWTQGDVRTRRQ